MRHLWMVGLLAACGGAVESGLQTGSSSIVATHRTTTFNVNPAEGTVSHTNTATGSVETLFVGDQPTRLARVGDEVWVTLRGERGIAIVRHDGRSLSLTGRVDAGVEPYGIIGDAEGRTVYVASAMTDEVLEIDASLREVVARHAVPDEPRWLALHPSGDSLFVGSVRNGRLTHVDVRTGETTRIALPPVIRSSIEGDIDLTPRITGDPSITPDGHELGVPVLYVDNDTPVVSGDGNDPAASEGYGSSGAGVGRLNPAVTTFELDRYGEVAGDGTALSVAATLGHSLEGLGFHFDLDPELDGLGELVFFSPIRSFPSSVTATDDAWWVTMEGSNAVMVAHRLASRSDIDIEPPPMTPPSASGVLFTSAEEGGLTLPPILAFPTQGDGPRGAAVFDDQVHVHDVVDRSVEAFDRSGLTEAIHHVRRNGFLNRRMDVRWQDPVVVETKRLSATEALGEQLFFSARDVRMAGISAGVSCSTCHFDGRNDGLTWTVDGETRQTPSLAGRVSETAPVTWTNDVDSVATEAMLTTSRRMGGLGLLPSEAEAIEAYVDQTPYPDPPNAGLDDARMQRGQALFEDPIVGCASCHAGPVFTDNQSHQVLGIAAQTPTLRGIAASAPYLHDGSMPTLESVVFFARSGQMGNTSGLSDEDVQALVTYLKSL